MNNLLTILRKIYNKLFYHSIINNLIKKGLKIGSDFHMQEEVVIDPSHCWLIEIGDHVTLAPKVRILAHDASTKNYFNHTKIGKVTIGNRVFIGESSIIMPGVKIGNNVIVGAGSIVKHDISDGLVVAGNPATTLCTIDDFLKKRKEEMNLYPCFDESYTLRGNISDEMKAEMKDKMADRYGYVI